jgi:hypothetical protein
MTYKKASKALLVFSLLFFAGKLSFAQNNSKVISPAQLNYLNKNSIQLNKLNSVRASGINSVAPNIAKEIANPTLPVAKVIQEVNVLHKGVTKKRTNDIKK